MLPPPWHHAQNTNEEPQRKRAQYDQDQWRSPLLSKEKANGCIVLIVERKREKGKKNGCFKRPLKEPCNVFHQCPLWLGILVAAACIRV